MSRQRWQNWIIVLNVAFVGMLINPTSVFAALPPRCTPSERGTYFADVTGDSKADAIVVNTENVTVRRSDGSRFLANESWTTNPYYGNVGIYFADVTGDSKADAIVVNTSNVTVRRSDGNRFLPNESWTIDSYYGNMNTYFADVTGDGKADAIAVDVDKVWVRPSNGSRFDPKSLWVTGERAFGDHGGAYFVEVTGDGKADSITVNNDKVWVRRSNGSRFESATPWTTGPFYGNIGTYFAEVMGDSAHAIAVNTDKVWVSQSYYTSFGSPQPWTTNPYYGNIGTYFADVTGDGLADAIVVNTSNVTVRRSTGSALAGGFSGNESWTTNPYFGDAYPRCSLYTNSKMDTPEESEVTSAEQLSLQIFLPLVVR